MLRCNNPDAVHVSQILAPVHTNNSMILVL